LNLAVLGGGIRMPLFQVAEALPVPVANAMPLEEAAATYLPPVRPRKQDRN
jgi:hypothetical protein